MKRFNLDGKVVRGQVKKNQDTHTRITEKTKYVSRRFAKQNLKLYSN